MSHAMSKAILLATDNAEISSTFQRIAKEHTLNMEVVSSVSDAVMAFVQCMHDLVFLSPGLEGGQGMELVKELASLSPRIVLLGERRDGFGYLALPLEEPQVLACLGIATTPAGNVAAGNAPAGNAPAGNAPAEEAPATQTPAEKTPAERVPAEKTPAEKEGAPAVPFAQVIYFEPKPAAPAVAQAPQEPIVAEIAQEAEGQVDEILIEESEIEEVEEAPLASEALRGKLLELKEAFAKVCEEKAEACSALADKEEALQALEAQHQAYRHMHAKLEAEQEERREEVASLKAAAEQAQEALKAHSEAAEQAQEALKAQLVLAQQQKAQAEEEVHRVGPLLERTLEERAQWQESRAGLSLEMQQVQEKLTQAQEEKEKAFLQLAELSEKWKGSEARLKTAQTESAFAQAEAEALKARAEKAEAALEAKRAECVEQAQEAQARIEKMEEEAEALKTQLVKSEAEIRAALAMAPAMVILPLSAPMPGDVFTTLEECLRLLMQTVATRPWLRLDIESRLGRRKLYISQGALVGVDTNCAEDVLLRQAQRDGFLSAKQYQSLRLLEERGAAEQLEVLLRRGFIREVEAYGLFQRYIERIAFEALSQAEAAFALAEERPGEGASILKSPQPFWPLLKEGMARRNKEARFLERFGGMEAIPVLKASLTGLVVMGMSKTEMRFFESIDGQTRLEELVAALNLHPEQTHAMLLTAWKLEVVEFAQKKFMHASSAHMSAERLFARFEEMREADYFDVLGVSSEASTRELKEAHTRLMEEFNPLQFAGHKNPKVLACAEQLTALVEEALGALEDEGQRRAYAKHLSGARPLSS